MLKTKPLLLIRFKISDLNTGKSLDVNAKKSPTFKLKFTYVITPPLTKTLPFFM